MQILAGVGAPSFDISGGQETVTVGGYKYVVFTSSGTLTLSMPGNVSFCTVGGGGGGGQDIGGGGGGGELDLFASFALTANATITVGTGGASATAGNVHASNGGTSDVVSGSTLQSALGGGGGGSYSAPGRNGVTGGSGGGGGGIGANTGGGASGSNTNVGAASPVTFSPYWGGGGGGATAAANLQDGGEGYLLTSIDANLTAANFPTTLTSKTRVSSGGGGGNFASTAGGTGGTNAGNGGFTNPSTTNATSPTSYGCGGGGGQLSTTGTAGFAGLVIARITL